jgi:hypothetical protein
MYVREDKDAVIVTTYNNRVKKTFVSDKNINTIAAIMTREMLLNINFSTMTLQTHFADDVDYMYIEYFDGSGKVATQRYIYSESKDLAHKVFDIMQKIKESGAEIIYTEIGAIDVKELYE